MADKGRKRLLPPAPPKQSGAMRAVFFGQERASVVLCGLARPLGPGGPACRSEAALLCEGAFLRERGRVSYFVACRNAWRYCL
jgi:hypothetical protein